MDYCAGQPHTLTLLILDYQKTFCCEIQQHCILVKRSIRFIRKTMLGAHLVN